MPFGSLTLHWAASGGFIFTVPACFYHLTSSPLLPRLSTPHQYTPLILHPQLFPAPCAPSCLPSPSASPPLNPPLPPLLLLLPLAHLDAASRLMRESSCTTWSCTLTNGYSIITSCLGSMNAQLQSCNQQDWDCLCEQSNNVKTCYNNCPTDPRAYAIGQQTESYCNAAKQ
ncbi:hypothetical protein K470DRAFT_51623 [Piedraia hortae CBS 480.64]|uniref:Uncharacterized protein n=1 Tax=Piedraia hortae CBS 480.64 TaxID=1314780 RepID=A0A6A7C982_9PEZI|nr:hypothetical protein K470DRAFT_51623 [Piedraia hortae CBS 480.64]